jgi:hypothetical protein
MLIGSDLEVSSDFQRESGLRIRKERCKLNFILFMADSGGFTDGIDQKIDCWVVTACRI